MLYILVSHVIYSFLFVAIKPALTPIVRSITLHKICQTHVQHRYTTQEKEYNQLNMKNPSTLRGTTMPQQQPSYHPL